MFSDCEISGCDSISEQVYSDAVLQTQIAMKEAENY
jgi:hypothetical protein